MWQYKEEFSPFFSSWSLAKHKDGYQEQKPVPRVIHLCYRGQLVYHQSWICLESGTQLQLSQKPFLPTFLHLVSYSLIHSNSKYLLRTVQQADIQFPGDTLVDKTNKFPALGFPILDRRQRQKQLNKQINKIFPIGKSAMKKTQLQRERD